MATQVQNQDPKVEKTEDLKKVILASEIKRDYRSDKFEKIKTKVSQSLAKQDTDEALRDITL